MRHAHAHVDDMPCATCHVPCATCHASYYTTFLLPTNALPYLLQGLLHHLPPTLLRLTCLTCYKVVDLGHARELPEHHLSPSFLPIYLSILKVVDLGHARELPEGGRAYTMLGRPIK